MSIRQLAPRAELKKGSRSQRKYKKFQNLLDELRSKDLPIQVVTLVNAYIDQIDASMAEDDQMVRIIDNSFVRILSFAKEEHGIVTKNYYRGMWALITMSITGLPLGLLGYLFTGEEVYVLWGIPMGWIFGYYYGKTKDSTAKKINKQIVVGV